jgi:hypothetical protein
LAISNGISNLAIGVNIDNLIPLHRADPSSANPPFCSYEPSLWGASPPQSPPCFASLGLRMSLLFPGGNPFRSPGLVSLQLPNAFVPNLELLLLLVHLDVGFPPSGEDAQENLSFVGSSSSSTVQ